MASARNRIFIFIPLAILASLMLSRPASAQCGFVMQQFQGIALEARNAFVAEYSTDTTSSINATIGLPLHSGLKSVARDSEGRVRVVRSAGKYTVKATDGVVTEIERLNISICDPTTATFTMLDTADKTATIHATHGNSLRIIKPTHGQGEPFCARQFAMRGRSPRTRIEDLGHQLISGYDAVGIRIHFAPLGSAGSESSASGYNELWCSDALGAVVQQTNESKSQNGRGFKNKSTMQNIERREPEVSLFQIPSDYTIIERATEGNRLALSRSVVAPSATSNPQ
jgi:hypothetical protein